MYRGDRARKMTLVDYGFRLPSALDNRPLNFQEFESLVDKVVYVSATPGPYEPWMYGFRLASGRSDLRKLMPSTMPRSSNTDGWLFLK